MDGTHVVLEHQLPSLLLLLPPVAGQHERTLDA